MTNPRNAFLFLTLVAALFATSCSSTPNRPVTTAQRNSLPLLYPTGKVSKGQASWYSISCNGGRHTASGEPLSDHACTAAHRSLPMGTRVRVTNLRNGRSEIVRITDRGPFTHGRIIDVTKGVAQKLDMVSSGVAPVQVEVLRQG